LEAAVADIKTATSAYARRQRTWFRREEINLRSHQTPVPSALAHLLRGWLLM
jgi:tRNA A37 N6-isopentenylltransferase MiaA